MLAMLGNLEFITKRKQKANIRKKFDKNEYWKKSKCVPSENGTHFFFELNYSDWILLSIIICILIDKFFHPMFIYVNFKMKRDPSPTYWRRGCIIFLKDQFII